MNQIPSSWTQKWESWRLKALPLTMTLFHQFAGFLILMLLTTAGETEPKCKHPFRPLIWGPAQKVSVLSALGDPSQSSQWQWSSQHPLAQTPWTAKRAWLGCVDVNPPWPSEVFSLILGSDLNGLRVVLRHQNRCLQSLWVILWCRQGCMTHRLRSASFTSSHMVACSGAEVGGISPSQPQSPHHGHVVEAHYLSAGTTLAPV